MLYYFSGKTQCSIQANSCYKDNCGNKVKKHLPDIH